MTAAASALKYKPAWMRCLIDPDVKVLHCLLPLLLRVQHHCFAPGLVWPVHSWRVKAHTETHSRITGGRVAPERPAACNTLVPRRETATDWKRTHRATRIGSRRSQTPGASYLPSSLSPPQMAAAGSSCRVYSWDGVKLNTPREQIRSSGL